MARPRASSDHHFLCSEAARRRDHSFKCERDVAAVALYSDTVVLVTGSAGLMSLYMASS